MFVDSSAKTVSNHLQKTVDTFMPGTCENFFVTLVFIFSQK